MALSELENLFAIDPGNIAGREIEAKIVAVRDSKSHAEVVAKKRAMEGESWREREEGRVLERQADREKLKQDALGTYRAMLKHSWINGPPQGDEKAMIDVVKLSLGISETDCTAVEQAVRKEAYCEGLRAALRNGGVGWSDKQALENLRSRFDIAAAEAREIEKSFSRD
jgi:hypothetical protein